MGNLLVSGNNQRMGRATGPVMRSKECRRRTAMPDFVMSVASSTVGLPVRFDRCRDPEGAIVGNGYPLLSVIRLFTPDRTALGPSPSTAAVVGAVVLRPGSRRDRRFLTKRSYTRRARSVNPSGQT